MIPYTFRVSRFDPEATTPERSWTSISDVGGTFEDGELTIERFEVVEAAYLASARSFIEESGVSRLLASDVDWSTHSTVDDRWVVEGMAVTPAQAELICSLEMRERLSCRLEDPGRFYVHFGFDLYMYVGSWKSCESAVARSKSLGLFVEPGVDSPYFTG